LLISRARSKFVMWLCIALFSWSILAAMRQQLQRFTARRWIARRSAPEEVQQIFS
jgi:hypothetical protein